MNPLPLLRQSLVDLWRHRWTILHMLALPLLLVMIAMRLPLLGTRTMRLIGQAMDLPVQSTLAGMNSAFQILSYLQIPLCLLALAWFAVNFHRHMLLNQRFG